MPGADQDGVDGVAVGAGETVAFEQAVGLGMADDRLDGGPSAQLAFDRWRPLARALRDVDFGRDEPVASVALVDVDANHLLAGEAFHLRDLTAQRVTVVGHAGHCLDTEHELAAAGTRIGDRDRHFDAELVARPRLALGNAFDLGGVERVEFVLVVALLRQEPFDAIQDEGAGADEIGLTRGLALDVAGQPARDNFLTQRSACLRWPACISRPTSRRACLATRR